MILKLIIITLVLQCKWLINLKPYITCIDEYWNACDIHHYAPYHVLRQLYIAFELR